MKDIKLLGKKILAEQSPVLFSYQPGEDWRHYWEPKSGTWSCENGYLIGEEKGNFGGILFSKDCVTRATLAGVFWRQCCLSGSWSTGPRDHKFRNLLTLSKIQISHSADTPIKGGY